MIPWVGIVLALLCGVNGALAVTYSDNFARPFPGVAAVMSYTGTFFFLSHTGTNLSINSTSVVWAGIGTALIALIGVLVLHRPFSLRSVMWVVLIVLGVVSPAVFALAH